LAALLLAADPVISAQIMLAAGCGLRAFEVAKVAGEDFTLGPVGLRLRVEGKRGRVDVVPVPPDVAAALVGFRRPGPFWCLSSAQLRRRFAALAARAGVAVTFHQLRHFYGTETYAATGQDLLMTQRLMRHSSPSTTAGYAATADAVAAAAVARIPLPGSAA
jgi:integrase